MEFKLSQEYEMLRKAVREFAKKKIAPFADQWDADHYLPAKEVLRPMGELGFLGAVIPEAYGGEAIGWLAAVIITEEIARVSSSLRVQVNLSGIGCAYPIYKYGTEAAREKYLAKLCAGVYLGGFAITEPNAGSDIFAIETVAEDRGDHYVVNGSKTWISNAHQADLLVLYCYTDRTKRSKGLSAFVIELKNFNGIKTTEVEAARLLVYKGAWQKDIGMENNGLEVAQAKYFAGEVAMKCANYALRILGAYGYSTEYPLARYYRDIPTYVMVEGSANICKSIIAADKLGYRKANR
jgi:alkylation response protein AidB-like acyl-CoA dehydrogenase